MNTKAIEIAKRMTTNERKWAGDVGELVDAVLAEEQCEWVPKVDDWVKCGGKVFRAGIINNRFVYHGDWVRPFSEVQKPTPEEIALAERHEKLPPVPEGWEWVVDRNEKPHPEAKWNNGKLWSERVMAVIAYNASYEYIKPIQPCRTEEVSGSSSATSGGKAEFKIEKEGMYRQRNGKPIAVNYDHETTMGISGYHTWRDNGKHECKMRIIECHRDLVEYLAPLPPEGCKLLNVKVGEALPPTGTNYKLHNALQEWLVATEEYSERDAIYAHKPASIEQPQAAYESETNDDTSEENKIGIIFNNADFWSIQTAMGVFEIDSGRFATRKE